MPIAKQATMARNSDSDVIQVRGHRHVATTTAGAGDAIAAIG
jgi:hypothetical protein